MRGSRTWLASRRRGGGFSMIELMVSLVIALVVVVAMLAAAVSVMRSDRHHDAIAQVTDDASFALSVMRQQLAQAGFSVPRAASPAAFVMHAFAPVLGCAAANFRDVAASILAPPSCDAPSADPAASDALALAYEASVLAASASNTILGGPGVSAPLDCLGNSYARTPDPANGDYFLNDSKFYVTDGSLFCHGPGNAAGAALVQNVEQLKIAYGLAAVAPGEPGSGQVAYYDAAPPIGAPAWGRVVAVRLCVQVRSASKVVSLDAAATLGTYVDCANVQRTAMDGYLRRTFSTTVMLQNRMS